MILTKEQLIEYICKLYKSGLTNSQIAEELEISIENVKSYMKRYIRVDKNYKYIKQLHDERKKQLKEVEKINKRVEKAAIREIENRVRKCISTEQLIRVCRSAYRTNEKGNLCYKYDKKTRPIDLPRIYNSKV